MKYYSNQISVNEHHSGSGHESTEGHGWGDGYGYGNGRGGNAMNPCFYEGIVHNFYHNNKGESFPEKYYPFFLISY